MGRLGKGAVHGAGAGKASGPWEKRPEKPSWKASGEAGAGKAGRP
jgi:hypothetical protein